MTSRLIISSVQNIRKYASLGIVLLSLLLILLVASCDQTNTEENFYNPTDWAEITVDSTLLDSLNSGKTYLSSYSSIYVKSENSIFSLTGTISMRNINVYEPIYISQINYYGTRGKKLRSYIRQPIKIEPLETYQIIITDEDIEGGTGDNFVFEWYKASDLQPPLFEGVFISTYGQQGISFSTQGINL